MRAHRSAVVSSALLFILGAGGLHPVPVAATASDALQGVSLEPLVIAEFYPCAASGDEYLVLYNRGPGTVNLSGWVVADGEGAVSFAGGTVSPGHRFSVSENATSYASAYGEPPDVEVAGWSAGDGVEVSGRFRLADAGDCIELVSPASGLADVVVYGDACAPSSGWSGPPVPALRTGEVVGRQLSFEAADTDSASDWMHFRELRYGHTDHGVVTSEVPAGNLTFFASPDCSLDVVLDVLSGASSSVRLCSYELSSASVCRALLDGVSRGVGVRVLVDAAPVGGMSATQLACLSFLARGGADVRVVGGDLDRGVVRHFGALHSKYIVVDDATLVALSENFVEDGVPVDRIFGNRGWGVSVTDCVVAPFMSSVFDDDSRSDRHDVWRWQEDARYDSVAVLPDGPGSTHADGMLDHGTNAEAVLVSVFLSPDVSVERPFLQEMIASSEEVCVEQFQAELMWTTRWSDDYVLNPLVDAVARVLRAGGDTKGVFDASWYNAVANTEVVDFLSAAAVAAGSEPSFALLSDESPVTTMHNKGLVLDGSCVVSSNNWVYASFARNRELAVVVEGSEPSSYFRRAFTLDRVPDTVPPVADAGDDVSVEGPCTVVLDASRSWDDRVIAAISWDIDGDGLAEAEGMVAEVVIESRGTRTVWVFVTDAWGNTASDSVEVSIGSAGEPGDQWPAAFRSIPWPLPAALSFLVFVVAAARKLNLFRVITRGKG